MTKSTKNLERQIENAYQTHMAGVQVRMTDLGYVSRMVLAAVLAGQTIEQGYQLAREKYEVK